MAAEASERNADIIARVKGGESMASVARSHGISASRVLDIVERERERTFAASQVPHEVRAAIALLEKQGYTVIQPKR